MRDSLIRGSTNVESRLFRLLDSSGSPHTDPLPGDFALRYRRSNQATATTVTTVSGTIGTPAQNSLVVDPDDSSVYEFGLPNTAKASGDWVIVSWSGTGLQTDSMLFDLIAFDRQLETVELTDNSLSDAKFAANAITADVLAADVAAEIAAGVETAIVNDGDATAVLQAVADRIAADWVAGDASPLAIVSALLTNATFIQLVADAAAAKTAAEAVKLDVENGVILDQAAIEAIDTELSSEHGSGAWTTGAGGSAPSVDDIATEVLSRIAVAHGSGSYLTDDIIKSGESRTISRSGQDSITYTETRA